MAGASTEQTREQLYVALDYWTTRTHKAEEEIDQLQLRIQQQDQEIKRLKEREAVTDETLKSIALLLEEM